jgi:hypothetical protein
MFPRSAMALGVGLLPLISSIFMGRPLTVPAKLSSFWTAASIVDDEKLLRVQFNLDPVEECPAELDQAISS